MDQSAPEVESLENFRRRLLYRSLHRGTKEMDILLGRFAQVLLPEFSRDQLRDYEALLELPDVDLYDWVSGKRTVPANLETPVLRRFVDEAARLTW